MDRTRGPGCLELRFVMSNRNSSCVIAAVEEYCSWGYFAQGAGSREKYYDDQWGTERETEMGKRSGYQVVPVNWSINTPKKKEFFDLVKEITQGR